MPDFSFTYKPGVPMTANGLLYGNDCETNAEFTQGVPMTFTPSAPWLSVQQTSPTAYPIPFTVTIDPLKLPTTTGGFLAVGIKQGSFQVTVTNATDTCSPAPSPLVYTVEVTVPNRKFKPRK
jgi:hypothetical protein